MDINKYLSQNQKFPEPPKPKDTSRYTFGHIITESEASKHYGFIYLAIVGKDRVYVGSKEFRGGVDWRTYTSSSDLVYGYMRKGVEVTWKVLAFVGNSMFLKSDESKWIYKYAKEDPNSLLNIVDAQGNFLEGKCYKRASRYKRMDYTQKTYANIHAGTR